jgi:hypothetical protein
MDYLLLSSWNDMLSRTITAFLADNRSGRDASMPHGVGVISTPASVWKTARQAAIDVPIVSPLTFAHEQTRLH